MEAPLESQEPPQRMPGGGAVCAFEDEDFGDRLPLTLAVF